MHSEGSYLLCRAAAPGKLAAQWQLTGMEASRPHRCRELIQVNIGAVSPLLYRLHQSLLDSTCARLAISMGA